MLQVICTVLLEKWSRYMLFKSKKMVIIRMGDIANPDNPTFALSGWQWFMAKK
jgi:hypothetical protein